MPLPSKAPASGPCLRVPTTISEAPALFATPAVVSVGLSDPALELERGDEPLPLQLLHLAGDLRLQFVSVR